LQAFEFIHGAIELAVKVSLVAEEFVGCVHGRQAEASGLRLYGKLLALKHIFFERAQPFQPILKDGDDIGV
jgi:hypothetical protein